MARPRSPHDKLFKSAFADVRDMAAELRSVLPKQLVSRLELDKLADTRTTFIDEAMVGSYTDALYTVRYAGHDALLYVLTEHKSEVDRWTLLQLLRYMVRIWEQVLEQKPAPSVLPPIIPVLVHHSETGWTTTTTFHGLFDASLMVDPWLCQLTPAFNIVLDDLSHLSDAKLRARALSDAALLALLFLRDGRRENRVLRRLLDWADLFRRLSRSRNGQRAIIRLFSYIYAVAPDLDLPRLRKKVRQVIPDKEDLMSTLAERLIKQGRTEGLEKGLEKGLKKGATQGASKARKEALARQRKLVQRQLELKFGVLPMETVTQVESANATTLERYAERVITCSSVAEVLSE
jgi:predicted transposase YdaD